MSILTSLMSGCKPLLIIERTHFIFITINLMTATFRWAKIFWCYFFSDCILYSQAGMPLILRESRKILHLWQGGRVVKT
ncbi:hypothetical protein BDV39DRAFT_183215 [Aspergillus sergii]|uniref:Uncharacterized protein n=1 Tax=Aspergillus sergii TaxID=1034303 RepID=A0A5N6WQ23_9EURO|nr:hypothetical protein BDV39DRAFT_183215 [Aspergillus sergii]